MATLRVNITQRQNVEVGLRGMRTCKIETGYNPPPYSEPSIQVARRRTSKIMNVEYGCGIIIPTQWNCCSKHTCKACMFQQAGSLRVMNLQDKGWT